MRSWRAVHLVFCLATDFVHGRLVGELGHKLVSLDVDVLFAGSGFGGLDVAREELFGSLCALLF